MADGALEADKWEALSSSRVPLWRHYYFRSKSNYRRRGMPADVNSKPLTGSKAFLNRGNSWTGAIIRLRRQLISNWLIEAAQLIELSLLLWTPVAFLIRSAALKDLPEEKTSSCIYATIKMAQSELVNLFRKLRILYKMEVIRRSNITLYWNSLFGWTPMHRCSAAAAAE